MAITSQDQLIAGMQPPQPLQKSASTPEAVGVPHSLFYFAGVPGAAVAPSPGINGAALTSYTGQIPFVNPTGGNLAYLAQIVASCSQAGTLVIADRLWHNSGVVVTTTTAQSITFPGLPARDANGTTNGAGVLLGIEVSTATTNAAAISNMTATYTNSAGVGSRTATIPSTRPSSGFPATAVAGTFVPFDPAAGDVGVRSVDAITLGTSLVTGAVHLVCYRVLAQVPISAANVGAILDATALALPQMYTDSVPFMFFIPTAASAFTVVGQLTYTQG